MRHTPAEASLAVACYICRDQRWIMMHTPPTRTYDPCPRCNNDGAILPWWFWT